MWTTARFRQDNSAIYAALVAAVRDATELIRRNPRLAAETFIAAEGAKLSVDFVARVLGEPGVEFSIAPRRSLEFAQFLGSTGAIKAPPSVWQDYFFPDIHAEAGS